jgi:hypothetical protein
LGLQFKTGHDHVLSSLQCRTWSAGKRVYHKKIYAQKANAGFIFGALFNDAFTTATLLRRTPGSLTNDEFENI